MPQLALCACTGIMRHVDALLQRAPLVCPPSCSVVTNTFDFVFSYRLERDEQGQPLPPKLVLPSTGALLGRSGGATECSLLASRLGEPCCWLVLPCAHAVAHAGCTP